MRNNTKSKLWAAHTEQIKLGGRNWRHETKNITYFFKSAYRCLSWGKSVLWSSHAQRFTSPAEFPCYRTSQHSPHHLISVYVACTCVWLCVCVVICWGGGGSVGGGGDNKWRQTWTSISVITRRAEQRQWQTSAWGPSIYETGHASNRKTPHTVMARGKAHRQLITALNFDASPRAGEKIYIIPLFLHRWWDTGCVCVCRGVCVCVCGVGGCYTFVN